MWSFKKESGRSSGAEAVWARAENDPPKPLSVQSPTSPTDNMSEIGSSNNATNAARAEFLGYGPRMNTSPQPGQGHFGGNEYGAAAGMAGLGAAGVAGAAYYDQRQDYDPRQQGYDPQQGYGENPYENYQNYAAASDQGYPADGNRYSVHDGQGDYLQRNSTYGTMNQMYPQQGAMYGAAAGAAIAGDRRTSQGYYGSEAGTYPSQTSPVSSSGPPHPPASVTSSASANITSPYITSQQGPYRVTNPNEDLASPISPTSPQAAGPSQPAVPNGNSRCQP